MTSARTSAPLLLLSAAFLLSSASSALAEPAAKTNSIAVRVLVARGGMEPGGIDKDCKELVSQLGPLRFQSLKLVQKRTIYLQMGQRGAVQLPTGGDLRIVPLSIIRERLHMRVEMPGVVNTRLRMQSSRPVIVGGPRHQGGHLIVQIIPEY